MDDNDQPGGSWSTAGWSPRKKQRKIITDRSRAERIALGHVARKINLGQAHVQLGVLREEMADRRARTAQAWSWVWEAARGLDAAAGARRGRHRTRRLDEAIDGVLLAVHDAEEELARLDGYDLDEEGEEDEEEQT